MAWQLTCEVLQWIIDVGQVAVPLAFLLSIPYRVWQEDFEKGPFYRG